MASSVVCRKCNVTFKYPELYEEHLRGDKSCPNESNESIELHHLHLIKPTYENQRRIVQLDLVIPMRIEMAAVFRDGVLRWTLISVFSDVSFPRGTP